jgi:Predicted membrane protein (DUF2207)
VPGAARRIGPAAAGACLVDKRRTLFEEGGKGWVAAAGGSDVGSPQERVVDQALGCAAARCGDGSNLPADAEVTGVQIKLGSRLNMSGSRILTWRFRLPVQLVVGGVRRPVRDRRRFDGALLVSAAVLAGVLAFFGAVIGSKGRITAMWAGAEVSADGTGRITEVIDWDYGTDQKHGIFRDVPGLRADAPVDVSSSTAPDQFEIQDAGPDTRIRIGDPSQLIMGRHRYRIGYPLDLVDPDGQVAWNAVGTGWPVRIGRIEIHVVAPFEITGVRCVQGAAGSHSTARSASPSRVTWSSGSTG